MPFSIYIEAPKNNKDEYDSLYYELIGVMDVAHAIEHYDMALVQEFFMKGHPVKNPSLKPLHIKSLDESQENAPFAFFIATKKVNPQSARPLVSSEDISKFHQQYPFIELNHNWQCWGDVLIHFKTS